MVLTMQTLLLLLKVAQSQNVFHVDPNLQRGVPNHDPEQYPPKKKMIRVIIWHPFLEIWAKVKNFLRLSHLYCPSQCSTTYDWLTGSSGHRIFQSRWQPMTGLTAEFLDDWHSQPRRGSAVQWQAVHCNEPAPRSAAAPKGHGDLSVNSKQNRACQRPKSQSA